MPNAFRILATITIITKRYWKASGKSLKRIESVYSAPSRWRRREGISLAVLTDDRDGCGGGNHSKKR